MRFAGIACACLVAVLVCVLVDVSSAAQSRWRRRPWPQYYGPLAYPSEPPFVGDFPVIRPHRFGPYSVGRDLPNGPYPAAVLPLPEGMIIDITPLGTAPASRAPGRLDRWRDVGAFLRACWSPPAPPTGMARPRQLTLRLGFNRQGGLLGSPRVTFADPVRTSDVQRAFSASVTSALRRCLPLPFTGGLGSAIAGVPFALRFIDEPVSSPVKERS